jgi:hypothetical protein
MPSRFYLDDIAAGLYTLTVILLTASVDARMVRYMTLVGHDGASLLRHWVPTQLHCCGQLRLSCWRGRHGGPQG